MKTSKYIDKQKNSAGYKFSRTIDINSSDIGGESIILKEDIFQHDGEKEFSNFSITLNCYGSHSTEIYLGNVDFRSSLKELEKVR